MDNETKEILQQILTGQQEITQRLDKLGQEQSKLEQVVTNTAKEVTSIKTEVASIKKDTTITRVAVNELISWTDTAASIIEVPFLKAE